MKLFFDKDLMTNAATSRVAGAMWKEVEVSREVANNAERAFYGNEAAVIPRDAYLEMDRVTKDVMRGDGGAAFMDDLMPLAKGLPIGKTIAMYRKASDAGNAQISMSGQIAQPLTKTDYAYDKTPIPIFSDGYFRIWREWESLRSEGFDALFDDQRNVAFNMRRRMARYVLDGDTGINVDGVSGTGIRTNPNSKSINIGPGGNNIDMTTATSDAVLNFWNIAFCNVLNANFITDRVNVYVSPEIMLNYNRQLSQAGQFKPGSLVQAIKENGRIGEVKQSFELTGNQFIAFVPRAEFIRPLIGMPVSTYALPRQHPNANYNFYVWGAMGLEIRSDYNGRSGVFYSVLV